MYITCFRGRNKSEGNDNEIIYYRAISSSTSTLHTFLWWTTIGKFRRFLYMLPRKTLLEKFRAAASTKPRDPRQKGKKRIILFKKAGYFLHLLR